MSEVIAQMVVVVVPIFVVMAVAEAVVGVFIDVLDMIRSSFVG